MAKPSSQSIRTIAFVSLGCPKNLVDSERMLGLLAQDGLAITPDPADADAIIINTCGFLEAAKEESLAEIRQAVALKHAGRCKRIIVAGCLVQRHKTKLLDEVPEIDRLVGVFDREHIVQAVRGSANASREDGHYLGKYHDLGTQRPKTTTERGTGGSPMEAAEPPPDRQSSTQASVARGRAKHGRAARAAAPLQLPVVALPFEDDRARLRLTPRHFAYLRISEGCNQGCSFCTIPGIRGPMRSKPIDQILAEARELAADGAVELNLIGQDTTSYGNDIGYEPGLSGLLATLDRELTDVPWVRLMYAYPSCFTDRMIRTIADAGRLVKYIDIPLQHINDQVLARMRRRVTRRQIETLLEKLRAWIPGIAIRTTFIAGSPGETDAEHQELVRFVRQFGFDMMGVFAYSQERGTPMGRMDGQLPDDVKQARVQELMLAQQEVAFARAAQMRGQTAEVLIDAPGAKAGQWKARTPSQAPEIDSVVHVRGKGLHLGQLVQVTITGAQDYDLTAQLPAKRTRSLKVLSNS